MGKICVYHLSVDGNFCTVILFIGNKREKLRRLLTTKSNIFNFINRFLINRNIQGEDKMTNEKALRALKEIKMYCSANLLDELDYTIKVMEKLIKDDVKEPLATDFTKLTK
jgi:hypothetical protein